jgi:4a-hydroxytetrahydrobiopterin dehydratase
MNQLAGKRCIPCSGGIRPIKGDEITKMLENLKDWKVVEEHHLEKDYIFKDYKQALDFVNAVSAIAEDEKHHPDLQLAWGKVKVRIYTHKIEGLSESDFILAAKCDLVTV